MQITWRIKVPSVMNARVFGDEMIRAMEGINKEIRADFEKTVATWDHKPRFGTSLKVSADFIIGKTRTSPISGVKPPELIYYFISKGTRVRYAIMTPDFEPKSRVRTIDSFPGAGGLFRVDPRFENPGIEGREFDVAIATKHRARVPFRLQKALRKAVKASGHQHS